jgi:hypothetical protein
VDDPRLERLENTQIPSARLESAKLGLERDW